MEEIPSQPTPTSIPPASPVVSILKPNNQAVFRIVIGAVILTIGIGIGLMLGKYLLKPKQITSYEECVKANGNQITLMFPGTCTARDGRQFTQPLTEEEKKKILLPDPTTDWKLVQRKNWQFKMPLNWNYRECYSDLLFVGPKITEDKISECAFDGSPGTIQVYRIYQSKNPEFKIPDISSSGLIVTNRSIITIDSKPATIQLEKMVEGQGQGTRWVVYVQNSPEIIDIITLHDTDQKQTFDQILSTFKFTDINGDTGPSITSTAKSLRYFLPSGWGTVQDKSGTFESGYDLSNMRGVQLDSQGISISERRSESLQGYTQLFNATVFPYDGGSKHQFIYSSSSMGGRTPKTSDYYPNYKEVEYTYNNRSCLFLEGISFSALPTTWGMCDIGNSQALLINTNAVDKELETMVQTIRLLK